MDLIPAAVADRLIAVSRLYGLWRGALVGFVIGLAAGAVLAIVVIRGVLS